MTASYPLSPGDTVVLRVDDGPWQRVTFEDGSVGSPGHATAGEVASVVDALEGVVAAVDGDGYVTIATSAVGGHVTVEVDPTCSAAPGLGLVPGRASAAGGGLVAARLIGTGVEPFALRRRARIVIAVDGRRRRVSFDDGFRAGAASADEVARVINAKLGRPVATARSDGRVALTSPSVGLKSTLEVEADGAEDGQDAAEVLGFVGAAAASQPYGADPARLQCVPSPDRFAVINLTPAPIELHLSSGTTVVPARATYLLGGDGAGESQLQRLVEQGAVAVVPARAPAAPQAKGELVDAS